MLALEAGQDSAPQSWDPRVERLADFVEGARGLPFTSPVDVEFIEDDAEYLAAFRETSDRSPEDLAESQDGADVLRVLGLVGAGYDPEEAADQLVGEGTAGFYDPATKRLLVKGEELTPYVSGTVVHELTHALQDQHFDLEAGLDDEDSGPAYRGLVEGDAVATELAYVGDLPADERERYSTEETELGVEAGAGLDKIPEAVLLSQTAPYTFGLLMREALRFSDGAAAVDAAFRDPPTTDIDLLDPYFVVGDIEAMPVTAPEAPDGADVIDDGEFGALVLAVMLGDRVGVEAAVDATLAWRGDDFVAYRTDDEVCVDAVFVGEDDAGTSTIHAGLEAWAATMPEGSATVTSGGAGVELNVCGAGEVPAAPAGEASAALNALAARSGIFVGALSSGSDPEVARCVADGAVEEIDIATLGSPEALGEADLSSLGGELLTACS